MTILKGVNVGQIVYYTTGIPWLNKIKSNSYGWGPVPDTSGVLVDFDADGYFTTLNASLGGTFSRVEFYALRTLPTNPYTDRYHTGTWVFLYDGTGSFSWTNTDATVVSNALNRIVLNVATATTTGFTIGCTSTGNPANSGTDYAKNFRLVYSPGSTGAVITSGSISGGTSLIFSSNTGTVAIGQTLTGVGVAANTTITGGSGTSWTISPSQGNLGPITMYTAGIGQYEQDLNDGELFDPDYIARITPIASCVRFLDWISSTNSESAWSDRALVGRPFWPTAHVPYENMIALCNKLNAHLWLMVPAQASADYIKQLANLTHSTLNSNLTAYFDFNNEIWQWQVQGQWPFLLAQGNLHFTGTPYQVGYEECLARHAKMYNIVKYVYGADVGRVKIVLIAQNVNDQGWIYSRAALATDLSGISASFTGSISDNGDGTGTLSASGITGTIMVNHEIRGGGGAGAATATYITADLGGGNYTVNIGQTVSSGAMTAQWWYGPLRDYVDVVAVAPYTPSLYLFPLAWSGDADNGLAKFKAEMISGGQLPTASGGNTTTTLGGGVAGVDYALSTTGDTSWGNGAVPATPANGTIVRATIHTTNITPTSAVTFDTTANTVLWTGHGLMDLALVSFTSPYHVVTFDTTANTVLWTAHGLANNTQVQFAGGVLPPEIVGPPSWSTAITDATVYYIVNGTPNDFQVAATVGGPAIDLTGSPSGTTYCLAGTLLTPLIQEQNIDVWHNYYVRNATSNDFQLSTTPTGAIVDLSGSGVGTTTCHAWYCTLSVDGGNKYHILNFDGYALSTGDITSASYGGNHHVFAFTTTTIDGAAPITGWFMNYFAPGTFGQSALAQEISNATNSTHSYKVAVQNDGKSLALYEFGQNFTANTWNANQIAARDMEIFWNRSNEMGDVYTEMLRLINNEIGSTNGLVNHYSYIGEWGVFGDWSLLENNLQTTNPKYAAYVNFGSSPVSPVSGGTTRIGNQYGIYKTKRTKIPHV